MKFKCNSFMPYKSYLELREMKVKCVILGIASTAIIGGLVLSEILSEGTTNLTLSIGIISMVSILAGTYIYLSIPERIDKNVYKDYIDNYHCILKDDEIIISRTRSLPSWIVKRYPPAQKEVYKNKNGVEMVQYCVPISNIKSIKMRKIYNHDPRIIENHTYIIEINTGEDIFFILPDHFEGNFRTCFLNKYCDLIMDPSYEGWYKKSMQKAYLVPLVQRRRFFVSRNS